MIKKIKILIGSFMLVLLPAFVLRPVVVCVHNRSFHAVSPQAARFFSPAFLGLSPRPMALRPIAREAPDTAALAPRMARAKAPAVPEGRLKPFFNSRLTPPRNFLVLRI